MFVPENIQARLRQRPFVPMRIVASTGQTFEIHHPETVIVTRNFLEIGSPSSPDSIICDHITRVALLHVVEIEDLPVRASPGQN